MAWFRDDEIALRRRHEIPLTEIFGDRAKEVAARPETRYGGLSLMYVRMMLRKDGPRFSHAREMYKRYATRLQREPVEGMICFWWSESPNDPGDIGLVVSPLRALTVGYDGRPFFKQIARDDYLGSMWWPEKETGHAE